MASSSKATLILLIYGILMHYSVFCTPIGLSYPKVRLENDAFDEDGNSLSDMGFDSDQIAIRSPPSLNDDAYTLYYPPEKRPERHAEEELDRALREILGQLTARHYLHSLMTIRAGEDNSMEDESEPLSKRHSDGIFTDSYSRYRKKMAVQKYLAAVLGRSEDVRVLGETPEESEEVIAETTYSTQELAKAGRVSTWKRTGEFQQVDVNEH